MAGLPDMQELSPLRLESAKQIAVTDRVRATISPKGCRTSLVDRRGSKTGRMC